MAGLCQVLEMGMEAEMGARSWEWEMEMEVVVCSGPIIGG